MTSTLVVKIIVVVFMLFILGSLGTALFRLLQDKGESDRTVRALTVRITLSIVLFVLLMLAFAAGLISPHPI